MNNWKTWGIVAAAAAGAYFLFLRNGANGAQQQQIVGDPYSARYAVPAPRLYGPRYAVPAPRLYGGR